MRSRVAMAATTVALGLMASSSCCAQQFEAGVPKAAFASVSKSLPLGARIESVRLFNDFQKSASSVAVLVSTKTRWRIYVFSPVGRSGYEAVWNSGPLSPTFMVATPSLRVEQVEEQDAIAFSGCVRHMCPDIFSSFLYVPSLHRAFIGTCHDGKTELSFQASPTNRDILEYLRHDLHTSDANGTACGPDTRERTAGTLQ